MSAMNWKMFIVELSGDPRCLIM